MEHYEIKNLAEDVAETVRDFMHYFKDLDHPKLVEWIEDTLKDELEK